MKPTMDDLRRASTERLIAKEQAKVDGIIAAMPWWKRLIFRVLERLGRAVAS